MSNENKPGRVKSAILSWLGVDIRMTDSAFWSELSGKSSSGQIVNAEKSLQLSAVWACVKLVSETVATLPFKIYEKDVNGEKREAKNHPLYRLLCVKPNPEMTPTRFVQFIIASILLRGNAFIEQRFYKGVELASLNPLLPQNMRVSMGDNGLLQYEYTDPYSGVKRDIDREHIVHLRGFGIDGVIGLDPMKAGKEVIGTALSTNEASGKFFENGLQASGFITAKQNLTAEQRDGVRNQINKFVGSKNVGKVMVLEGDLDYKAITINPETAQLIESRGYSVEEICRWFGVPPVMIGHMDKASSWASSLEMLYTFFLTTCLRPILVNIEQEYKQRLFNSDERYYVEFNVEGLLRADSAGRAAYYNQGLNDGWLCRNEVRAKENLPPITGGDKFTIQMNMTTIDKVGEEPTEE